MRSQDAAAEKFCKICAATALSTAVGIAWLLTDLKQGHAFFPWILINEIVMNNAAQSEKLEQLNVVAQSADIICFCPGFCSDEKDLDGPAESS